MTPQPNFDCPLCGRAIGHEKLCPYFKDVAAESEEVETSAGEAPGDGEESQAPDSDGGEHA
jgi:hypothetical protein